MDDPLAVVVPEQGMLTRADVERVMIEPNGPSALIVLMRNGKADPDMVIDAITRMQNNRSSKAKRAIIAFFEAILQS